MALRVWLPLNGNTNNYGISDVSVTNNGATVDNNGKIGKCYSFDGTNDYMTVPVEYSDTMTFALWYKPSINSNSFSSYHHIFDGRVNNTGQEVLCLESPSFKAWGFHVSTNLPQNIWTHICAVNNKGTVQIYINGILVGTGTTTMNSSYNGDLYIGSRHSKEQFLAESMNDIRIYDHALSAKEVKEIAKGLVLHYPLKDRYIENTTNIDPLKDVYNNFHHSIANATITKDTSFGFSNCWKININKTSTTTTYHYLNSNPLSQGASIGDTVTRSCLIYIPSNQTLPNHFRPSIEGNSTNKKFIFDSNLRDQWQEMSLTGTLADNGTNNYLFYFGATSTPFNVTFYIKDIQMEIKDHATPYTSSSRSETIIYDSSGYSNNGTKSGTITYESNSPRYSGCLTFDAKAHIKIPKPMTIGNTSQFTVSMWVKPESGCGGYAIVASNYNYPANGFWMAINTEGSGTWFYNGTYAAGNPLLTVGSWHHIVMVFNAGTITWYTNGVATTTSNVSSRTTQFTDYIALGNSYTGTSWNTNFVGSISDFRIYATALSNADILELYNTAMSIDKAGNIYAYEYKEI